MSKPEPAAPIHHLLDLLRELQLRLSHTGSDPSAMNVIEAYSDFIERSKHGRSCTYALKCKSLFLLQDYQEIHILLEKIMEYSRIVRDGE